MNVKEQITGYIASLPEAKQSELEALRKLVLKISPKSKVWFLDGKNEEGKVVTNPNIGFGSYSIKYADGSTKEFYQVGLSANTTGISVYIMGHADKGYLATTYGKTIGKATVTGYCIKFKKLTDIDLKVLEMAIRDRLENQ
ncbi:MAG: DUF1801 domain-containing protein [Bacteroidia bacterium]